MNQTYEYNSQDVLNLKTDLAGEFPLYLYWNQGKNQFLYSKSFASLLSDERVPKPLKVSDEGLSFLLQSGVIPAPRTAYEDIYTLSVGDSAEVKIVDGIVEVVFSHEFPFKNSYRLRKEDMQPDDDLILRMVAEATIIRVDESRDSFVFHSAGKDSNTIALALAEAGWQDNFTLVSHQSKGSDDESRISAEIARRLGFKHRVLFEIDDLNDSHKSEIQDFFCNSPFPCADNVTLAYPLYAYQMPGLKGANIVDGIGNDNYMMTPPTSRQLAFLPMSWYSSRFSFMRSLVRSESLFVPFLRTPAEWFGGFGFSFGDCRNIFKSCSDVYGFWVDESMRRREWDVFDFKTDVYTSTVCTMTHLRKVRNFTDAVNSNLILPFSDEKVCKYFSVMPEEYLFDRRDLRNKIMLRQMLKKRIGLDSDLLGKMSFAYDSRSIVLKNWSWVTAELNRCPLWNHSNLQRLLGRLRHVIEGGGRFSDPASRLIYMLFLVSMWRNYCRYLNG